MDLASTMSDGKEFQALTTLLEKKFSCQLVYYIKHRYLLWPLVTDEEGNKSEKITGVKVTQSINNLET